MENTPDQQPNPEQQTAQQIVWLERANDFLETCDRISTGYESGLYWDDVQRALRIAAGLEKWPD